MAGRVKKKLAILLVEALANKGAIATNPDKIRRQFPTARFDCAMWYCSVNTKFGIGIEVFGWSSMSDCVKHGVTLTKVGGFYDVCANYD